MSKITMMLLFFLGTITIKMSFAGTFLGNTVMKSPAQPLDKTVVWQRAPIEITLPVGKERFISFPTSIKFGYNIMQLPPSVLRVENDDQTLYLLAKKPFNTQRVEARLASGEIILLDVHAIANASDAPIDIIFSPGISNLNGTDVRVGGANVNYVSLVRYAIQQLYAPKRLLKGSQTISRFPMETMHIVPLSYDGSIAAMPLASWQNGNLFVTALSIKNLLNQVLQLDPRTLCGDWKAASFYPNTELAARGAPLGQDSSTLFLVSTKPFSGAIQDCL